MKKSALAATLMAALLTLSIASMLFGKEPRSQSPSRGPHGWKPDVSRIKRPVEPQPKIDVRRAQGTVPARKDKVLAITPPDLNSKTSSEEEQQTTAGDPDPKQSHRLEGRVLNLQGEAIAGATVVARSHEKAPLALGSHGVFGESFSVGSKQCSTDRFGRFSIEQLPRCVDVLVMATGYETQELKKHTITHEDLNLGLKAGGEISGRVVDSQGQPQAELQIKARLDVLTENAWTDKQGRFKFVGLRGDSYWLKVDSSEVISELSEVKPGQDVVLRVQSLRPLSIRCSTPIGSKAPQKIVIVYQYQGPNKALRESWRWVNWDSCEKAFVTQVPITCHHIRAVTKDLVSASVPISTDNPDLLSLNISLEHGARVHFEVVIEHNRPGANAVAGLNRGLIGRMAVADEDGRVVVKGLLPGAWKLWIRHKQTIVRTSFSLGPEDHTLDLGVFTLKPKESQENQESESGD